MAYLRAYFSCKKSLKMVQLLTSMSTKSDKNVRYKIIFYKNNNIHTRHEQTFRDELVPMRRKSQQSSTKVMATVIWHQHEIIFNDYL